MAKDQFAGSLVGASFGECNRQGALIVGTFNLSDLCTGAGIHVPHIPWVSSSRCGFVACSAGRHRYE
jgi:hypothetical protein